MSISIVQSDCLEAMAEMGSASITTIFADPPYNTGNKADRTVKYDKNADFARKNWHNFHSDWDSIEHYYAWSLRWIRQAYRILRDDGTIWICGSFHNIPECALALRKAGFYTIQWVQWCIPNAFPNLQCAKMANSNQTLIWARKGSHHYYDKGTAKQYNDGKNLRDYWIVNNDCTAGKQWKHPSKKPVELVARALNISTPKDAGAVVLDPFAGSGTTGIAAQKLGLDCVLIERKPEYAKMIRLRLSQMSLLDEAIG